MSAVDTLYQHLAADDDPAVDRALAAALPTADGAAQRRIVHLLLERGRPEGCTGLVLCHHRLDEDLAALVERRTGELGGALRRAARQRRTRGPLNAVRLIRGALSAWHAELVTELLRRGEQKLADAAASCLLHLAEHARTDRASGPAIEPRAAAELLAAVELAVVHYPAHQHRSVLLALCCLLPRPAARARATLSDVDHPAVGPMRRLLAEPESPAVRRALIWALGCGPLTEPALAGLRQSGAGGVLGEALERSHLLAAPAWGKALRRCKDAASLWPDAEQRGAMDEKHQRALPRWAAALPFDESERAARLVELGELGDATARLGALRQLLAMSRRHPSGALDDAVARFALDADGRVARLALWRLVARRYGKLMHLLGQLVNSPHEPVRRIAAQQLAPLGFERLWTHWPTLSDQQRLACGRALIKIDPSFHRQLGERLARPDGEQRVQALMMIGRLNQGSFFAEPLVQLSRDGDERVAASAVAALGSAEGEPVRDALHEAPEHDDARVRANAVEALAQLQSVDHVHRLVELAGEDANRPRANAIGALMELRTADAVAALKRMLDDGRSDHRRSALWLVEQLGLFDVAREVAEMSISDPDDDTRRRAAGVVRQLLGQTRREQGSEPQKVAG